MSIYEKIIANLDEYGMLPTEFSLESSSNETNEIPCAAGIMDGVCIYHRHVPEDTENTAIEVAALLSDYLINNDEQNIKKIEAILKKISFVFIVDRLGEIMWENLMNSSNHDNPIDWERKANLWTDSSLLMITKSENMELVKIGITMLGVVGFDCFERSIGLLSELAVYEGLTIYALEAIRRLSYVSLELEPENPIDYNAVVFDIAQKVRGWGKVHAIERLEPETDEIRDWILHNGCSRDDVLTMLYLGLVCAEKSDMISALREEELDNQLFESVSTIMEALLNESEGPVPGMSAYEHAEEAIELYFWHTKEYDASSRAENVIYSITKWLEENKE